MSLKTLLRKNLEKKQKIQEKQSPEELLKEEDDYFKKYMNEWNNIGKKPNPKGIPQFYWRLPKENDVLQQKLREETRSSFLQRRSHNLLDNNELKALWMLLDHYQTSPNDQLISYSDYKVVTNLAGAKLCPYFTANIFARLQQNDPHGQVSIMSLFNYVMRKVWLQQTRIGLSLYDVSGQGYLREADLESYIADLLPTLPQLEGLESSFHSFYVCTAVRKFIYFLDGLRAGRVRILDILVCSFLDDLLELRDKEISKEVQEQNWFSAPSALRVYGQYLNLDRDHNGMLCQSELANYGSGTLTQPFVERVFQTCLTYGGEMDYKTYLDLVLTLENRSEPQALAFLFRMLDLNDKGYLDAFVLNYFFRAIQDQMRALGAAPVSFEDVKDELFDMVKSKDPEHITLNDLYASGQGDTFVSILIEFHRFWNYENREAVTADPLQD
ncbi:hypothetical protein PPYR_00132 [Photinus pyralis]|uniref:EF-hand domain-containing protein n=2 Tax=Photinus pyralis TaxID=7054 RepID=A0A1Y1K7A5_PHOPY|nr:serine/threonine-protein phosphatase 2A regulatory subunit B'' subunit gamma-like isoform X1 [Photinus pyralis]KAB0803162.1 hypothetical protein PPYR_00132 [Photinus pyralis]